MNTLKNLPPDKLDKFIFNELTNINDIDLLILKGHIFIEFMLDKYIEALSNYKDTDFSKENFTFAQKIKIIKHFGTIGSTEYNFNKELMLLNILRNNIAHDLTYNKSHLELLFKELDKKNSTILERYSESRDRFIASIAFIYGTILGAKLEIDKKI